MSNLESDQAVEGDSCSQQSGDRVWSREFVELLVTQFVFGLVFSVFHLLPKFLRLELGASATQIGRTMGVGLVAAVLATPFSALWLARGARRKPACAGLLMLVISALAFTQVERIGALLYAIRAVQGLAFTLFINTMVTRGAELVPKARLAQAMGWVGLAALITNALSPLVAEPVSAHFGWRWVFLIAAGCGMTALALASRMDDSPTARVNVASNEARPDRSLWFVLYAAAICGMAIGTMFTFTQPLALERGARDVGRYFSGYVLGAATMRLLFSGLADRWGRGRVSTSMLVLYSIVVALTANITPATLLFAGIGLGIAHGVLYPALNAMALERATDSNRAVIATLFGGAFSLGNALSVMGLGVVADAVGYGSVFFGTAALTLTGAAALLGTR